MYNNKDYVSYIIQTIHLRALKHFWLFLSMIK